MKIWDKSFLIAVVVCAVVLSGCSRGSKTTDPGVSKAQNNQNSTAESGGSQEDIDEETVHEEGAEILQNEGTAEDEALMRSAFSMTLPFEEGDDKVCAIAYLGSDGASQEQNLRRFFDRYCPEMTEQQLRAVRTIDYGGSQCYLIIPRYQDSRFSLSCLEQEDNGSFKIGRTDSVSEPVFILYCNPAQYANAEISIVYMDRTYVMMPRLNTEDGQIEPMQVALDLTEEIRKEN